MTYQGMRRDQVSQYKDQPSYILIPRSGDKLPERIDPPQALRLVQSSADRNDDDLALLTVSERIQGSPELESQVRAFWMTDKGLLIHGTMDAAFRLSDAIELRDEGPKEASRGANVTFLGAIRKTFEDSVAHYTGRALGEVEFISATFGDRAAPAARSAANGPRYQEPQLALAA